MYIYCDVARITKLITSEQRKVFCGGAFDACVSVPPSASTTSFPSVLNERQCVSKNAGSARAQFILVMVSALSAMTRKFSVSAAPNVTRTSR